jgi:hypothetical protein
MLVPILSLVEPDDTMSQIYMPLPFQRQDFIPAHAGIQGRDDDRLQMGDAGMNERLAFLLH